MEYLLRYGYVCTCRFRIRPYRAEDEEWQSGDHILRHTWYSAHAALFVKHR